MKNESSETTLDAVIARTTLQGQIITIALVGGLITFFCITVFVLGRHEEGQRSSPLTIMGLCFSGLAVIASPVISRVSTRTIVNKITQAKLASQFRNDATSGPHSHFYGPYETPDERIASVYQSSTIIGQALLEGPGFFLIICFMIEHQPVAAIIAGLLVLGILAYMPTRGRVRDFVENQRQRLRDEGGFDNWSPETR